MSFQNNISVVDLEKIEISDDVKETLNGFSIKGSKGSLSLTNQSYGDLYERISSITGIRYRNEIQEISDSDNRIEKILQCIKWARILWGEAIENVELDKAIISYSIAEYLSCADEFLNWDIINKAFLEKLRKSISSMTFKMAEPDEEKYHRQSEYYSDKKYYQYYQNGLKNNDLIKIFTYIDAIEKGNYLSYFNQFIENIIKMGLRIDLQSIHSLIETAEPAFASFILEVTSSNSDLLDFLIEYQGDIDFPLIKGFINLSHHYDSVIAQNLGENNDIDIPIEKLSIVFSRILERKCFDDSVDGLGRIGRLSHSMVFHSVCALVVVDRSSFIEDYVRNIDFSLEEHNYSFAFCSTLFINCKDEIILDLVAKKVAQQYYSIQKKRDDTFSAREYTHYYDLLMLHIRNKSRSKTSYQKIIRSNVEAISDVIYSWRVENMSFYYMQLFHTIISNMFWKYKFAVSDEIEGVLEFLRDERQIPIWDDVDPAFLIQCLLKPDDVNEIEVIVDKLKRRTGIYSKERSLLNEYLMLAY